MKEETSSKIKKVVKIVHTCLSLVPTVFGASVCYALLNVSKSVVLTPYELVATIGFGTIVLLLSMIVSCNLFPSVDSRK